MGFSGAPGLGRVRRSLVATSHPSKGSRWWLDPDTLSRNSYITAGLLSQPFTANSTIHAFNTLEYALFQIPFPQPSSLCSQVLRLHSIWNKAENTHFKDSFVTVNQWMLVSIGNIKIDSVYKSFNFYELESSLLFGLLSVIKIVPQARFYTKQSPFWLWLNMHIWKYITLFGLKTFICTFVSKCCNVYSEINLLEGIYLGAGRPYSILVSK